MKPLIPYLFFDGNCREALEFYKSCFGGELQIITYADGPKESSFPKGEADKVMHGHLAAGELLLMASDNPMKTPLNGDNVHLSVNCETMPQIRKLFANLGAGGQVKMPLADTFWGSHFGMLTDRFGIHWMLSHPLEK